MKTKTTLEAFFHRRIGELEREGRFSTSRNYRHTWESFREFSRGRYCYLDELEKCTVTAYNHFLAERGLTRNTISFYNRTLRAVYNKAVEAGLVRQTFPFEQVYTGVDQTRKRALPATALQAIARVELSDPAMALARDLFLFSFQARGMSFVDMAYLRRQHIRAGAIHYVRRKTGQALVVTFEPWMQEICARYADQCFGSYLLPILHTDDPQQAYRQYTAALFLYNNQLHRIGEQLGFDFPLTSYCARHSWATIARDSAVPLSVISSGMGHASERTTRIYLASLENSLIDQAARQVWQRIVG